MVTRLRAWIISLTFIAVLGGGAIAQLLPIDRADALAENRIKAAFPRFDVPGRTIPIFTRDVDQWFSDHFQLRNELVAANSEIRNRWLHSPSSPLVIFGRDGWLYYTGESSLWFARKANPFTPAELKQLADILEQRTRALASRGVRYVVMVAPDPATIYPEHQPAWLRDTAPGPARLDQLMAVAAKRGTFTVIDLRGPLLAARAASPALLYRPTGTHWNDRGAFIGYQALLSALRTPAKGVSALPIPDALPIDSFSVQRIDTVGGDMAGLLVQRPHYHESMDQITPAHSRVEHPIPAANRMTPDFTTDWRHTDSGLRVIVFRDSYFNRLQPFFSESFPHVRYLLGPYRENVVLAAHPDIVIEELVERYLALPRFLGPR